MMKYVFLCGVLCLCGCTDSKWKSYTSLGSSMRVTLYSGGEAVKTWVSTGKVTSGEHGTRFAFVDSKTKAYVRVTGDVCVEEITK
jgi:hypothetical protein